MHGDDKLMTLSTIPIKRHPPLCISKNPFLDPEYFDKRKRVNSHYTARNGEEMLEPYELETLTYGS